MNLPFASKRHVRNRICGPRENTRSSDSCRGSLVCQKGIDRRLDSGRETSIGWTQSPWCVVDLSSIAARLLAVGVVLFFTEPGLAYQSRRTVRAPYLEPEISVGGVRGIGSTSKKNMTLDLLVREKNTTRGPSQIVVRLGAKEQLRLGIDPDSPDPTITATVEFTRISSTELLRKAGLSVLSVIGQFATVRGPLSAVSSLADDPEVKRVELVAKSRISVLHPSSVSGTISLGSYRKSKSFSSEKLPHTLHPYTGLGVAIAVIDTGIDWHHRDFLKRDGSTRILALYDIEDQSWRTSHGKIGCKPPIADEDGPLGTVYTSDQINLALRGKAKVGSRDMVGHGTAVAGVACGNGLSANAQANSYQGVAPDASLIVIRAGNEDMTELWAPFAQWAKSISEAHHMPLVVNISAGSQYTSHDGTTSEELELNEFIRSEKKGLAVVTAAGNEGEDQIVATGRFNSRVAGLAAFEGKDIEVTSRPSEPDCVPPLVCYFKHQDDWGLMLTAGQAPFVDEGGNAITMEVTKAGGKPMVAYTSKGEIDPRLKQRIARSLELTQTDSGDDSLTIPLPAGVYTLTAFGSGPKVLDGRFMFSLPMGESSFFSMGASPHYTISSPGNASSVITVGSYNNRNSIQSKIGPFHLNTELGTLADYSSRGFRRDGLVKPDLVGPGSLQVSSLAEGSDFQRDAINDGGYEIAASGKHTIWQGTSAAAPYVTGVIAQMLQKNPNLGSEQIRSILIRSAKTDKYTGATPNPDWGFGKVDLDRALALTPNSKRRR